MCLKYEYDTLSEYLCILQNWFVLHFILYVFEAELHLKRNAIYLRTSSRSRQNDVSTIFKNVGKWEKTLAMQLSYIKNV